MRASALSNLRARRNPDQRTIQEASAQIQEDEAVQYLVGAMQPVEDGYTRNTIDAANRVFAQIQEAMTGQGIPVEQDYQGSVTKNTHILAYSDIDLLVLHGKFYDIQPPQETADPAYQGNPLQDLLDLRATSAAKLRVVYPTAKLDESKSKCLCISGGSLKRKIDVVLCNRWHTVDFANTGNAVYKGFAILDNSVPTRQHDQPFIHGAHLEHKDNRTFGNAKALIRLLKVLKYDSEKRCEMSSYDIESIVYHMPDEKMHGSIGDEILLAVACKDWLTQLEADSTKRNALDVPDGKRKVFATDHATLAELTALRKELQSLLEEIENSLTRSYRRLNEAKVKWNQGIQRTPWYVASQRRV